MIVSRQYEHMITISEYSLSQNTGDRWHFRYSLFGTSSAHDCIATILHVAIGGNADGVGGRLVP